ncbi:MAG: hypothetical protein GSR81_00150 [Desulfurococcales archaeon]|nr:hypothetical protein [Desulfurococcales archaeon]
MLRNKFTRYLEKSLRVMDTFLDVVEAVLVAVAILLYSLLKISLFRVINKLKFRLVLAIHMRGADPSLKQYLRETYDKSLLIISPSSILGLLSRGSWRWRRQSQSNTYT